MGKDRISTIPPQKKKNKKLLYSQKIPQKSTKLTADRLQFFFLVFFYHLFSCFNNSFKKVESGDFVDPMFSFCKSMALLKANDFEYALLSCIIVFQGELTATAFDP